MLLSLCLCVSQNSTGGVGSGERSYLAPPPYNVTLCSGERSYLAPPPYLCPNVTGCLCVSQNSTGGVGVDSNVTVCLCVSQNGVSQSEHVLFLLLGRVDR